MKQLVLHKKQVNCKENNNGKMTELQQLSFEIIANVGEAKSYAFAALDAAKNLIKLYTMKIWIKLKNDERCSQDTIRFAC